MFRAKMACRVLIPLLVLVGLCMAIDHDPCMSLAVAKNPDETRLRRQEQASLRRWLREAAEQVAAARGEYIDGQRSASFDVLAKAQENVGDTEGGRISREQAVIASALNPGDSYESLKVRAFDLARANKTMEAERAYKDAVGIALHKRRSGRGANSSAIFSVVFDGISLALLVRDKDPESASRLLLQARTAAEADEAVVHGFFVVRYQIELGDVAAARASLDEFQPRIDALQDPIRRLEGLNAMVAARWSLGDKDIARALCKAAVDLAHALPAAQYAPSNPMKLPATMFVAIEDYDGAFRIADEETNNDRKGWILESVVESISQGARLNRYHTQRIAPPIERETARKALRLGTKSGAALKVEGDLPNVLATILELQAHLDDLEGARESLKALVSQRDSVDGRLARAKALVNIARAEWKAERRDEADGDFAAALLVADSLPERGQSRGYTRHPTVSYPRDEAITAVILARAELGDVERAIEASARVHDPAQKAQALASAARARNDVNDLSGALTLAKAPGHGFPTLPRLIEIADTQTRAGDFAAAEATLRFALKEAEDYVEHHPHDPTIPTYIRDSISDHWDRQPEGREREIRQHASAMFEVAKIRVRLGDAPGAQKALQRVDNARWREIENLGLLAPQLEAGDASGAFAQAFKLPSPTQRLSAIFSLSHAISRLTEGPRHRAPAS